jgi:4-diphosphocytidyl-2-C-methyl-D-erythritol kinase
MIPIPFCDILEIIPSDTFIFKQTGLPIPGDIDNNLCVKAYQLMKNQFNIPPVMIHLRKIIPMGGGLGGGSSDAAFILTGINTLFNLGLSNSILEELAEKLGSDCPFFIKNVSQLAKGRGEILSDLNLDLKGYFIKIINLGIHVGTKEAYGGVHFSSNPKSIADIINQPISKWKGELVNDFEQTVFTLYPQLDEVKQKLYSEGAVYAAMSGSGSTLFGIFKDQPHQTYSHKAGVIELIAKY